MEMWPWFLGAAVVVALFVGVPEALLWFARERHRVPASPEIRVGTRMVLVGWRRPSQYSQIEEPEGGHVFRVMWAEGSASGEITFHLRRVESGAVVDWVGTLDSASRTRTELDAEIAAGQIILLPEEAP